MNAAVMCEKCGKPLGVFEGNICNECENKEINDVLEQIRAEQEALITTNSTADYSNGVMNCLNILDKYR